MKKSNLIIAIFAVVIILLGIFLLLSREANAPTDDLKEGTLRPADFSWQIESLGASPEDPARPRTQVALEVKGSVQKVFPVGTYDLSCATPDTFQDENELNALVCWFAGGGKEIGVFEENGKYFVKEGDVDEGSAETPGFRGNFKTLFEIK